MIFWYWYLLAAAALSFAGYITLSLYLTLALAAAVHLLFQLYPSKNRFITGLEAAAAGLAALALLWKESFLAPVSALISFLTNPKTRPTAQYMLEFTWQFVNFRMLAAGLALFAALFFARRKKPLVLGLAAYVVFASAWIRQPRQNMPALDNETEEASEPADAAARRRPNIAEADGFYNRTDDFAAPAEGSPQPQQEAGPGSLSPKDFFRKESGRVVSFPAPSPDDPPFDVLILHVCSLSWKDLRDAGSDLIPFFSKFDYVFTNFSAACSYSGPAVLRVLKSPCGQAPHPKLYEPAPAGCYLLDDLRGIGFKTYTMLNNEGRYGDFSVNAQKYGHADAPLGVEGLTAAYQLFNGDPMYPDDASLRKLWKARQDSKAARAALYYNTANLHIGTHKPGVSLSPDIAASYRERLEAMIAQFEKFFAELESSGRNAVVVFVPEHGAALSGNRMQAKDVRDIPLPTITAVPVAVKLIGKSFHADAAKPQVITKPASLQAVAWFIAEFLRHNPFDKNARRPGDIAAGVPRTDFLAEDENAAVMKLDGGYIYRLKGGKWKPLPDYAGIPPGAIPSPQDFRQPAR